MQIKFGTDGFRGIIGKDFTFDNAIKVSAKAMRYFKDRNAKSVAIGYDTRFLSPEVAFEIAEFAKNAGFDVFISKSFCTTPMLSLFTKLKADFGIMITASHNPPIYNGVKIKEKFGGSALTETIEKIANTSPIKTSFHKGKIKIVDLFEYYIKYLQKKGLIKFLKNCERKILVNPMYGSSQGIIEKIFFDTSVEITEINNHRNPSFDDINPEPMEENLAYMVDIVKKGKFDIAFAYDGDGDRIACFDREGNFYSSQKILPIFLEYLIEEKKVKGSVIKTVSVSSIVDKIAKINNLNFYEVPIGFKNIVPYILREKIIIGGEESGGIYINGYIPERDGIFCSLFMLEILNHYKNSLKEIWKEIENKYGTHVFKRKDFHFSDYEKLKAFVNNVDFDVVLGNKVVSKNFLDGKKFIFKDGFLLIRLSGTEPVLRIYVESISEDKVEDIFNFIAKKLKNAGIR